MFHRFHQDQTPLGYDDSLDVFGVHAVGGIIGALLTGIFCAQGLGGVGFGGDNTGIGGQVWVQLIGVTATVVYSGIVSFVILKAVDGVLACASPTMKKRKGWTFPSMMNADTTCKFSDF